MTFSPTRYTLQSYATGQQFADTGWLLDEPNQAAPSLIRAIYGQQQLDIQDEARGLYRFASWLPIRRMLQGSSSPVTFKSQALADYLGLTNLYITFSGYWPEKGATMPTCSFKETEAYTVCARMPDDQKDVLVVASAGNTARAFARVCSDNQVPLLLCVPADNLDALWFDTPIAPCVKLISTASGSDYFDAIRLSNIASTCKGFVAEGGAKNVARRDGMATTMLSAAVHIGRIPEYYFQAIGSGTGAIAAWEANLRLIGDGRFGNHLSKLMLSQNAPFAPMADAWDARSRELFPMDDDEARKQVEIIDAKVLSNRKPPYPIAGGLYDALCQAGGHIYRVANQEAAEAAALFESTEGCDIHPAAAVAVGSLVKAARQGEVNKSAIIMLNITGGGEKRFKQSKALHYLQPVKIFGHTPSADEVAAWLSTAF